MRQANSLITSEYSPAKSLAEDFDHGAENG